MLMTVICCGWLMLPNGAVDHAEAIPHLQSEWVDRQSHYNRKLNSYSLPWHHSTLTDLVNCHQVTYTVLTTPDHTLPSFPSGLRNWQKFTARLQCWCALWFHKLLALTTSQPNSSPPYSTAKSTLFDQVPQEVPRQLSPVRPARVA